MERLALPYPTTLLATPTAHLFDEIERRPGETAVAEANSSHLIIDARDGFFHAMLSYRVRSDSSLVAEIHDKLHLLASNAGKSVSQVNRLLDSSPFPEGFNRDERTLNSSLRVFLDRLCLKDGASWEGDGGTKSGGFIAALRLSLVFVPVFSATEFDTGSCQGSVGPFFSLAHQDRQDNVLLELIIARELHLLSSANSKTNCEKALFPCSYIVPIFCDEYIFPACDSLPKTASASTNAHANWIMQRMGIRYEDISAELRDGSLTVHAVLKYFVCFQGVTLYKNQDQSARAAQAANKIFSVIIEEVSPVVDYLERQVSASCMHSRRCNPVLQPHVHM